MKTGMFKNLLRTAVGMFTGKRQKAENVIPKEKTVQASTAKVQPRSMFRFKRAKEDGMTMFNYSPLIPRHIPNQRQRRKLERQTGIR